MQHFLDGDRQGVLVAEYGVRQRITHQDDVNPSLVHQARRRVVVRGQTGDRFVLNFLFLQGSYSDLSAGVADRGETHVILQCTSTSGADSACTPIGYAGGSSGCRKNRRMPMRW